MTDNDVITISDMLAVCEAARFALADDDLRAEIGERLDLSDQHLHDLLLKIERFLNHD